MARANNGLVQRLQRWRRGLWGQPGTSPGRLPQRALRASLLTADAFRRNHLSIHASGLTFYLLLSVVPFLAFVLLVLRAFQVAERLRPHLLAFVAGGNPELVPRIDEYIRNAQTGMLGGVGVGVTLVIGYVLLQRVRATLNLIWDLPRSWAFRSRLIEFAAVLVLTPLLMAAAFGVSGFLGSEMVLDYVPDWIVQSLPAVSVANLTGFAILLVVTYYGYRYLPDARVEVLPAAVGAVVATAGLMVVQKFYLVLIVLVSRQSPIYGALALLPFLMLWFYVAWLVFLAGAQLSFVVQHYERELELRRAGESALAHRPYLALLVLTALLRRLSATGKGVRRRALARELRLPADTVHDVLTLLTEARLVTPVKGDGSRYVPQEVLERLTVLDVLQRADMVPGFPDVPLWHGHRIGHPLLSLFRETNRALATPLAAVTLRELAERLEPAEDGATDNEEAAG